MVRHAGTGSTCAIIISLSLKYVVCLGVGRKDSQRAVGATCTPGVLKMQAGRAQDCYYNMWYAMLAARQRDGWHWCAAVYHLLWLIVIVVRYATSLPLPVFGIMGVAMHRQPGEQ